MLVCTAVFFSILGCSAKADDTASTSASINSNAPEIETEKAAVKDVDALDFIKDSYTEKELGLDKVDKSYSFMIASKGVKIDNKEYVKVVANHMKKNEITKQDGKETFSIETLGEYFISFDGKTVLKKDMKTGEYTELENRYADYSSKGETTSKESEN